MADEAKQFIREFWSKTQHWRLVQMMKHYIDFLNTWRPFK